MIVVFDVLIFTTLIVTALLALRVRDLMASVALLSAYSLFAALLFAGATALDVALVEAALGAGLTGVLFITAVRVTTRRTRGFDDRRTRWLVLPLIAGVVALLLYASSGLPDRGDPESPAQQGVSTVYLRDSLDDTQTPNVVTSVLADYRSHDTLGETLVIATSALAAALVLARRPDDPSEGTDNDPAVDNDLAATGEAAAASEAAAADDRGRRTPGPTRGHGGGG